MSTRQEKLELARKKLKQYKKQKQQESKKDRNSTNVSGGDSNLNKQEATTSAGGVIEDLHSQSQLSSNSSLNGSVTNGSYHHVVHSSSSPPVVNVTANYDDMDSDGEDGAPSSPYSVLADAQGGSPNTQSGLVMTMIPPPDRNPNSSIVPSIQFTSSEELLQLKVELETAAATISALSEEKQRSEAMIEATKNYYNEQFTRNAEVYTSQVNAYQQSMMQSVAELEKKYTVEVQYRQKLEEQISEFQNNKEQMKKENTNLRQDLEKTKEIVDEMQEKLLTKTNFVHNLEIKNEELANSLELANISLKQHRVSIMNLEDSKSKDRKMQFEKEQLQIQITKSNESVAALQKENTTLTEELKKQREITEQERTGLKNEIFSLKELNEKHLAEKTQLQEEIEKLNDQISNIEAKYILRSDVTDMNSKLQQATIEREQLIAESDSKSKKFEKLVESMNKITAQYDTLEEENAKLKRENVDKRALVEKSENDRVTISRALGQNAELKEMVVEKDKKIDQITKELQSSKDKVSTIESKAENYDSIAQELFLAKNELENRTQELNEVQEIVKEMMNRDKYVDCEAQTEEVLGETTKAEVCETGSDPISKEEESYETQKESVECTEVSTSTPDLSDLQKQVLDQGQTYLEDVETKNAEKYAELSESLQSQTSQVENLKKKLEDVSKEKQSLVDANAQRVQELEAQLKEQNSLIEILQKEKGSSVESSNQNEASITASNNALKDNYRKLQVKMQALGKECELLRYQNNQLETTNAKLAGENDTIGDYIYMYHAQREAMKTRDKSKSECLDKVMKEKDELTQKVSELQYLLTSILSTATGHVINGQNATSSVTSLENGNTDKTDTTVDGDEISKNQSSIVTSSPSELLNSEIKAKMIEALETVKSVSTPAPPHHKYQFSSCKCCQGQLIII